MSADYKPGDTVLVRGEVVEYIADVGAKVELFSKTDQYHAWVRPDLLTRGVVLDLDAVDAVLLREGLKRWAAWSSLSSEKRILERLIDQIEAQTEPARIPEPGLWGVVEAHIDGEHGPQADYLWIRTRAGWETVASMQRVRQWDDLIDPTLIREGLS